MKPRHPSRRLSALLPTQVLIPFGLLATLAVPSAAQAPTQFQELPRMGLPVDSDSTWSVALGDVDDDGDLDMVVGNAGWRSGSSQNRLYLNDGSGSFSDATGSHMPVDNDATHCVALGDVDGDGDLDIVIGNRSDQQNRLYLNGGSGIFTDATGTHLPVDRDNTRDVALGDVDGDGDLDIVMGNGYPIHQNRLYLNDGRGRFSDATVAQLPVDNAYTSAVALGDVDGDGDLDIVTGNGGYAPPQNRLYLNDGAGNYSDATASHMPVHTEPTVSIELGDLDGDGDLDLAIGNAFSVAGHFPGRWFRIYMNDGAGSFAPATPSQLPQINESIRSIAIGDVDGDRDLDLIVGSSTYQGIWLNDGSGAFADATSRMMPVGAAGIWTSALGDVDGDGDLDLAVGADVQQNRLYLNLQRQLHAPAEPHRGLAYRLDAYLRYGPSSTVDLAAVYLSTGSASLALPPLGTLGIDLALAAPFPLLTIPQPAGVGSVSITVPNAVGLIGQEIYSQALLFAYPNDLRLSNVVRDVIR